MGTRLSSGAVARVCDLPRGRLGKEVARYPERGQGYKIYDSAPRSAGPRPFYVTGFNDKCARTFTASLALFASPTLHEQLRYGLPAKQMPYSATEKAYETIKVSVCKVSRRQPCGSKVGLLEKNTAFISIYDRIGSNKPLPRNCLHLLLLQVVGGKRRLIGPSAQTSQIGKPMAKQKKQPRPKAVTPKGFRDYFGADVTQRADMLQKIAGVYHRYGFDALESSAVETVEALGKFLPDVDRPNEGVFAWQEDEADWLALRYDLTAPLARVYAQFRNDLPTPYRRYAMGPVWRNEKPGPRRDESGDFTNGAGLSGEQAEIVMGFMEAKRDTGAATTARLLDLVKGSAVGEAGVDELMTIAELMEAQGYGTDRIEIDPSVVRGLGYYTGPVYEAELTFEIEDEKGRPRNFGSVSGGGRYDDLVKRFTGQEVPATGVSIGVDRLLAALRMKGRMQSAEQGPVVVTVMDKARMADYQAMVAELRNAGIRAEVYLGNPKNFGNQLKYADKRNSPVAGQGSCRSRT